MSQALGCPTSYVWHLTDNGADEAIPVAVFNFL